MCGHSVSSTDRSLPGYHESGSSVPSDRWLGQGGLGPRKTSAARDGGSSLDGAWLGLQTCRVQGCRHGALWRTRLGALPTARWVLMSVL